MLQARHSFLAAPLLCALLLPAGSVTAHGQATSADTKLTLRAGLVLTREFCDTTEDAGGSALLDVGKAACAELEPALKALFTSVTRVTAAASAGDADVVLLPRFANIAFGGEGSDLLLVWLEWTVKDKSGKTVWIGTVQGSLGPLRYLGSGKKWRQKIVTAVIKHTAEESARAISSAPELRKLAK
jgi:hypothetical protein